MTSRFPTLLILLTLWTSPEVFGQENIPNDPYYKDQISFHNPGGRITLNTRSYKPSSEKFDAEKGIDLNIEKAWGITTGSKNVVVAILDDGFCYDHRGWKSVIDDAGFGIAGLAPALRGNRGSQRLFLGLHDRLCHGGL
jgi:hypothetical protein